MIVVISIIIANMCVVIAIISMISISISSSNIATIIVDII